MLDATKQTAEFIRTFEASLDPMLWEKLVKEELAELSEALLGTDRAHVLKEAADLVYVTTPFMGIMETMGSLDYLSEDRIDAANALIEKVDKKLAVVISIFGEDIINEAIQLVHESNMSKLGEDGKPIRREDGKILKGPNYKEPDLSELVKQ